MTKNELKSFLIKKPGYQKKGANRLSVLLDIDVDTVREVLKEIRNGITNNYTQIAEVKQPEFTITTTTNKIGPHYTITVDPLYNEFLKWKEKRKVTTTIELKSSPEPYLNGNINNVLIIGDLHCPWTLNGYLEFCREQQEKFNCGTIIFIGDLVDGNSWSYHEHDPDGSGQNEEINQARQELKRWFHTFPVAKCTLGNHDLLVTRKAKTHGLSSEFLRPFNEIWGAPKTWEFGYDFTINNVRYVHGDAGDAIKIAIDSRISTVQGHLHTKAFTVWSVSEKDRIFGLQVGCGIDHKKYAFAYAKPLAKKPIIGCGVVLESGNLPINLLMNL